MKNIFKRNVPEWILYFGGALFFASGIVACVSIVFIPLGVFGIILGLAYISVANHQLKVKKRLKNLKVPKEKTEEPIITDPPKEKKLLK